MKTVLSTLVVIAVAALSTRRDHSRPARSPRHRPP